MKATQKEVKGFGGMIQRNSGQIKKMGLAITAMGTAALFVFKKMIDSYATTGDMIHKMALRTGFSAEALSELAHAAEISGTNLTTLEKGVKKMAKTIVDAETGLETYVRSFDRIGLSVKDLIKLSPEEQFERITEAIAELESPTLRAATAQEIFGRAGTELLPLMAEGKEGLKALREEAHKLGIIYDEEAAAKAAKLKDAQTRLKDSIQGVTMAIAENLVPIITELTKKGTETIKRIREWIKEHPKLTGFITKFGIAMATAMVPLGAFMMILPGIIAALPLLKAGLASLLGPLGAIIIAAGAVGIALNKLIENYKAKQDAEIDAIIKATTPMAKAMALRRKLIADEVVTIEEWSAIFNKHGRSYKRVLKAISVLPEYAHIKAAWDAIITKHKEVEISIETLATKYKSEMTPAFESALPAMRDTAGLAYNMQTALQSYTFGAKKTAEATREMTEAQVEFSTLMIGALVTMEASLKGFVDAILGSFEKWALGQIIPKIMAALPFPFNLLATAGAIAAIKTIFKGIRGLEEGGRVGRREPVLVGEAGPEVFAPGVAGTIIPLRERMPAGMATAGAGPYYITVNQNIYPQRLDDRTIEHSAEKIKRAIDRQMRR